MTLRTFPRLVAVVAAGAVTLTACGSGDGGSASNATGGSGAKGGTLTLGTWGEPRDWDPAQAHVGHVLQPYQLPYDTLLMREPDGTLSPMLATEWEYTDDTLTTLSLELRTDVTFSDGTAFNADAVKANVEHFKADNGPQQAQLADVSGVTVVDEDTVEIALSQPNPALEYYLSQAAGLMASPGQLDSEELGRVPVGSGPYVLNEASSVAGSQWTFTAREDYWNPELQRWDQIVLRPLEDGTARVNGLVSGEIDGVLLDPRTAEQAESSGMTLVPYEVDWSGLLLLDRDGGLNPALADVKVRQAINHAFDREALLEQIWGGYGTPTSQVFGPESGSFVEDLEDRYPYDPEKARELLAEAGYGDGFTMQLPLTAILEPYAPFIVQQLADVGITVEQTSVPGQDFVPNLVRGQYPVAFFSLFQGPTWVAVQQMISTDAAFNPFDTTSPELQELVDTVRAGGDGAEEAGQEINRYVTENAWFVPWYRAENVYAVNDRVTVEPTQGQAVPSIYNYTPAA
jgi:peptide/nickel transport system substrate-binding protein